MKSIKRKTLYKLLHLAQVRKSYIPGYTWDIGLTTFPGHASLEHVKEFLSKVNEFYSARYLGTISIVE